MAANDGNSVSETPSFQVQASLDGTIHSFACRADQTVLAAAEAAACVFSRPASSMSWCRAWR